MMNCPACGYPNDASEHRCEKCGIRFALIATLPARTSAQLVFHGEPLFHLAAPKVGAAGTPRWRSEVSERVARYRKRRAPEATLPLEFPAPDSKVIPFPSVKEQTRSRLDTSPLPVPATEEQPALDFPAPTVEFPVAPLCIRALAGAADAAMVAIGYGLLFLAYHLAGGHLPWHRLTLLAALAILAFLPLFYLFLFLTFASETPGMRWFGLKLVDFYDRPASRRRRLGRVLASVASTGSLFLGFFWAVMDEEHLTWHDRMSESCLRVAADGPMRKRPGV